MLSFHLSLLFDAGLFALSTALSEILPSFKKLKELYQRTLIPQLRQLPVWGLAVLATGAGVGEEALFRGVLQPWVSQVFIASDYSVVLGIAATSIVFGAVHSVTLSYFIFATAAGAILGVEYMQHGLPAAAFTHTVYDFIAFVLIIQLWGGKEESVPLEKK